MLSPEERAAAALKLRVLQADLIALSVVETTAQTPYLQRNACSRRQSNRHATRVQH